MSTIQAICPSCGSSVRLEPNALLLLAGDAATTGTYLFCCDGCGQVAAKPARPSDIVLLATVGVRDHTTRRAGPQAAPSQGPERPFTADDIIDFHQLLDGDDWLPQLLAGTYGSCT